MKFLAASLVLAGLKLCTSQTTLPLPGPNQQLANYFLFDSLLGDGSFGGEYRGRRNVIDVVFPWAVLSGNVQGSDLANLALLDSFSDYGHRHSAYVPLSQHSSYKNPLRVGSNAFSLSVPPGSVASEAYFNSPVFLETPKNRDAKNSVLPFTALSENFAGDDLTNLHAKDFYNYYPVNFNAYYDVSDGSPFLYGEVPFTYEMDPNDLNMESEVDTTLGYHDATSRIFQTTSNGGPLLYGTNHGLNHAALNGYMYPANFNYHYTTSNGAPFVYGDVPNRGLEYAAEATALELSADEGGEVTDSESGEFDLDSNGSE